jgi:short-subunit dehydrogenase
MAAAARPLAGRRALVTGASSGIGAAIAARLAARGADLAITARRTDRLRTAAAELAAAHGVRVDVVSADLGRADGTVALWDAALAGGPIDVLVNNAGAGYLGRFATEDIRRDAEMIELNVTSLVALCHRFVAHHRAMTSPHPVRILNVASTVAFQAVPHFAVYAASKAFVHHFTLALAFELRGSPITATCLYPGGTTTEFHGLAGAGNYGKLANASKMTADDVAEIGVRGMLRGKRIVVPGLVNKLSRFGVGVLPAGLAARAAMAVIGAPKTGGSTP